MARLNKCIFIGYLTADPELQMTSSGKKVTTFQIAIKPEYAPKGANAEPDFATIIAWDKNAEFVCRFFGKGNAILVIAQLKTRVYEDNRGAKRRVTEFLAEKVDFIDKKEAHEERQITPQPPQRSAPPPDVDYGDAPYPF